MVHEWINIALRAAERKLETLEVQLSLGITSQDTGILLLHPYTYFYDEWKSIVDLTADPE